MSWTPDMIACLRQHWGQGKSAKEIGNMIGKSKNAVIGKADRLGLKRLKITWTMRAKALGAANACIAARAKALHERFVNSEAA